MTLLLRLAVALVAFVFPSIAVQADPVVDNIRFLDTAEQEITQSLCETETVILEFQLTTDGLGSINRVTMGWNLLCLAADANCVEFVQGDQSIISQVDCIYNTGDNPSLILNITEENNQVSSTGLVRIRFGTVFDGSGEDHIVTMNLSPGGSISPALPTECTEIKECDLSMFPVELFKFKVDYLARNEKIKASWTTTYEADTEAFYLERSTDLESPFVVVSSVPARNLLSSIQEYQIFDVTSVGKTGNVYYRLKIVDYDGAIDYSEVHVIQGTELPTFELAPNPTSESIRLSITPYPDRIEILSFSGRRILETPYQDLIRLPNELPDGTYLLRAISEGYSKVERFMISR